MKNLHSLTFKAQAQNQGLRVKLGSYHYTRTSISGYARNKSEHWLEIGDCICNYRPVYTGHSADANHELPERVRQFLKARGVVFDEDNVPDFEKSYFGKIQSLRDEFGVLPGEIITLNGNKVKVVGLHSFHEDKYLEYFDCGGEENTFSLKSVSVFRSSILNTNKTVLSGNADSAFFHSRYYASTKWYKVGSEDWYELRQSDNRNFAKFINSQTDQILGYWLKDSPDYPELCKKGSALRLAGNRDRWVANFAMDRFKSRSLEYLIHLVRTGYITLNVSLDTLLEYKS